MLIKNIIFGEKYFEHVGELKYTNHSTGDIGKVKMIERNWDGTVYLLIDEIECLQYIS